MASVAKAAARAGFAVVGSLALAVAAAPAGAARLRTITCTFQQTENFTFDAPAKLGALPAIDFDYPAKATLFSFRDGHLLLVAMDEEERSRLRIVISAQRDKRSGAYDGQIVVDRGGHQLQLYSGPVSCRASR